MKVYRILCLALCAFALAALPARAQQYAVQFEEKTVPVGEFTAISVSDDFEVSLVKGPHSVTVNSYLDLSPYVQVYVRAKVLYIGYDEKSVPKDVKKMFKGRGAPNPVFRAVVYMPELKGVTLSNNATLSATEEFIASNCEINVSDKAQIKSLSVKADQITVTMKKNAQASLNLKAVKRIEVNTDGNANLKLSAHAPDCLLNALGSSDVVLSGESTQAAITMGGSADASITQKTEKMVLQVGGTSKLNLSGEAQSMTVQGEKSALVEANGFSTKTLDANLSGSSKVNVAVSELINATLVGGSALYYTGTPTIKLGKIIKSTLAPYGSTAK